MTAVVTGNTTPEVDTELKTFEEALKRMAAHAQGAGDSVQSSKLQELAEKLSSGVLTIAFCGHFSAGKSTLVNALCGAQLLPSSPIPTSANVVTIRNGTPNAKVEFRAADGTITVTPELSVEQLGSFAVDGEGVSAIDVTYPIPLLGDRMALIDTPGVDSTDGAHRAATESALHLADVVFYVTDYNHVLSEVNFRFLRTLHQWGKPTYVIVNQIDKHREQEVSFNSFREGIMQALSAWRIEPAGLLFLSLREPGHPLSQREELIRIMESLKPLTIPLMLHSADRSARYLAEQFKASRKQLHADQRDALLVEAGGEEGLVRLEAERIRLTAAYADAVSAAEQHHDRLKGELDRLLANANLTPAETREKSREVLESLQPGFKVGWIGSQAKTEAERERRLNELARDFNAQLAANLHNHVRDLLRREAKGILMDGAAWETEIEQAFHEADAEWLKRKVKTGAGAGGDATLQYASDISADWKAQVRRTALGLLERVESQRKPERDQLTEGLRAELALLEERSVAANQLQQLDAIEQQAETALLALLPAHASEQQWVLANPQAISWTTSNMEGNEQMAMPVAGSQRPGKEADAEESLPPLGAPSGAAELLEEAAALLQPIAQLRKQAESLTAKAEQLRRSRFTIALFGAFSAGKSSFANALVGVPALPVSPNPTTATINRILAPSADAPHGSALIAMKSPEAMREDLTFSLDRLGVAPEAIQGAGDNAEALLALSARMTPDDMHPRGRPHLAFLRAAASGWRKYGNQLGQSFIVDNEAYRRYVAEEEASCFVASIDLHIDSPLTRSGAVLVDTPGADSINARHTGVAFEYIKNADAVLFVTYYNHAFTEADRGFLNQLGSVKDAFELDKMFFVLNAADLASSPEELTAVTGHVETQLLKHGIRHPRIYPVSSLRGVEAKQTRSAEALRESGLAAFEEAFRRFAAEELGSLALASARKQLARIGTRLEGLMKSASEDAASRQARTEQMLADAASLRAVWEGAQTHAAVQPIVQELEEQLYHLRRRVQYRFSEHFLSAFHPSVLQDDGRDLKKLIYACWLDLKRGVSEDLQQELRSAGLRLEGTLERRISDRIMEDVARTSLESFAPELPGLEALHLPISDPYRERPVVEARKLWSAFRSPKQFFENEGNKALRSDLESELLAAADHWLDQIKLQWSQVLETAFRDTLQRAAEVLLQDLGAYADGLSRDLLQPGAEALLAKISKQWEMLQNG